MAPIDSWWGKSFARFSHCSFPKEVRVGSGMLWLATERLW